MPTAADQIQASLLKRAASGAGAAPIAASVVSIWHDIDAALSPIIGHRGVAALLGRSIHLTRATHPWLSPMQESTAGAIDFAALQTVLSQQPVANLVAVNGALLEKFIDLLTRLIGVSLTERLLHSIVEIHSTGGAA